jgi:hypothetical protein
MSGRILSAQKIIRARDGAGVEAVGGEEEKIVIMPPKTAEWK